MVVVVDRIGAWDRVRSGGGRVGVVVVVSATVFVALVAVVHLPPAQFGVVRVGAVVRNGGVVVIFCEEREAIVLCPRAGRGVPLLRTVVLTSLVRGTRVDEDALLLSSNVRAAVPSGVVLGARVRVRGVGMQHTAHKHTAHSTSTSTQHKNTYTHQW